MIVGAGFLWFAFAVVIGVAAHHRGRNALMWLLLALFISPMIAGFLLIALPRQDFIIGDIEIEGRTGSWQSYAKSYFQAFLVIAIAVLAIWAIAKFGS